MKKRKKNEMWKKIVMGFMIGIMLLIVLFLAFYVWLRGNINREIQIEYGTTLSWHELFKKESQFPWKSTIAFSEIQEIDDYNFKISYLFFTFPIHLQIKDTTPPKVTLKEITQYIDEELPTVSDFLLEIEDLNAYEIEPIQIEGIAGEQIVEIKVTDQYGNSTRKETKLTLLEYNGVPVFSELDNLTTDYGVVPNLKKNVTVTDERFGDLDFSVDDSSVNYYQSGTYTITYSATNPLGNSATATRKITVKEKPVFYKIANFPTYSQFPTYPNGCESIALYTLLKYYNVEVTPEDIVNKLKKGVGPYWKDEVLYGGDPEIEFVGDPKDPHGYGVYQKPIIEVANQYKSGIIDYSGHSLNQVLDIVKRNIPVQVWVSIDLKDTKKCTSWINPSTGKKIDWICNLHSVVIIGQNSNKIIVSDPYNGSIVEYSRTQFEKMYNLFGKRAIYYEK